MKILIMILIVAVAIFITYKATRSHYKTLNSEIRNVKQAKDQLEKARLAQEDIQKNINGLQKVKENYLNEIQNVTNSLNTLKENAQKQADNFYQLNMAIANQHFEEAAEKAAAEYRQTIEDYKAELDQAKIEGAQALTEELSKKQLAIQEAQIQLDDLNKKVACAIESAKRQEEMETKQDFYRIQLSDIDLEEIEKLRSIEPYLRNAEPLNKIIWKVYYEKPLNSLIGRVIGSGTHIGIYKITEIATGKSYVGQSLDLASRWKQHVKRGLGAEAATRNKLYPAMREAGPENFTFEVIEECLPQELDAKEDYWQDYFGSITYGFSIK